MAFCSVLFRFTPPLPPLRRSPRASLFPCDGDGVGAVRTYPETSVAEACGSIAPGSNVEAERSHGHDTVRGVYTHHSL